MRPEDDSLGRGAAQYLEWVDRSCPVCSGTERKQLFRDRNRREGYSIEANLMQCEGCGMRYLDPVPSSNDWLSKYSAIYASGQLCQARSTSTLQKVADRIIGVWIRLWSPGFDWHTMPVEAGQGRRLLDIGCGTGKKLAFYYERGFEVYGIDVAPEAIAQACQSVPQGHFQVGRFETADYPENYFSVIRFDNVLEHIYDPAAFLHKVYRLLQSGGMALGFVPNGISPTMTLFRRYSINSWVPFHLNLFTPLCLRRLAQSVGFDACIVSVSRPEWAVLSVKQWRSRRRRAFTEKSRDWCDRVLFIPVVPIWWLLGKLWQGEELVLVATK